MSESVLELHDLTKSYKDKRVLDRLDLKIPRGSVVGLLGKNAAGKTTLIKCALGLLRPDYGETTVFNEPAWTLSAQAKARLGYVPQVVTLYPWMKVVHIIEYTASFYPHWNDELIGRLREEWGLDPAQRIHTLSVGDLQKLAILLAIGHEPELLILDEPAASLDPESRRQFLAALLQLAAQGERTVLFSTHITSDLERVADRVAVLKGGKIVYHDELDELKQRITRLHISAAGELPSDFGVPGMLRCRVEGNGALVSAENVTPEVIRAIEGQWSASVEVESLSLEDIFLELHRA